MEKLSIDHGFFRLIIDEHRLITDRLRSIKNLQDLKANLNWLWDFIEMHHHKKEEIILFKSVANNKKLSEGGPFCTLYYDMQIATNPIQICEKLTGKAPPIEANQKIYYDTKSPLCIPLDDHRSGCAILKYLKDNIDSLSEAESWNLFENYRTLMISHMEKEEKCFLRMCVNLMSPKQCDDCYNLWQSVLA